MSTHTGEVLPVNGVYDYWALCPGTLTPGSIMGSAEKAFIVWLILEEIMVNSQSDFCWFGLVFV